MPAINVSESGESVRNHSSSVRDLAPAKPAGSDFINAGPPSTMLARYGPACSGRCCAEEAIVKILIRLTRTAGEVAPRIGQMPPIFLVNRVLQNSANAPLQTDPA